MNTIPPTGITVQVGVVSYVNSSTGKIYVKQTTPLAVPASIITGTLGVANGGTGLSSLTANYVPYGNGTSAFGNSANLQFTGSNLLVGQTYDQGTGLIQANGNATINGNLVDKQLYLQGGNNLGLYSQDYSQASWTKNAATITTAYATAPDGTSTANRVVFTAGATSSTQIQQTYTATLSGLTLTVSAWVKSNTGASQTFQLKLTQAGVADHYSADQTATTSWQRFTYTFAFAAGGTGAIIGVANGSDSLAKDLQVWGIQLELGSVASSYTPTTSAIVTTTNNISVPSGSITTSADSTFNTVKVGLGGGNLSSNMAVGYQALNATNTGTGNVGIGYQSLTANTSGTSNTALGYRALFTNISGSYNVAVGSNVLQNSTGSQNTSVGMQSMGNITTGGSNVGLGFSALGNATIASNSVAIGHSTLNYTTSSGNLTAVGHQALTNNTSNVATLGTITGGTGYTNGTYAGVVMTLSSGSTAVTYPTATIVVSGGAVTSVTITSPGVGFKDTTTVLTAPAASIGGTGSGFSVPVATLANGTLNTAVGYQSAQGNTTGSANTALGYQSLYTNTTSTNNLALGYQSLFSLTGASGGNNMAVGPASMYNLTSGQQNIAIGASTLIAATTASFNSAIGFQALYNNNGAYNVAIGHNTLQNNTTTGGIVGIGALALQANTTNVATLGAISAGGTGYNGGASGGPLTVQASLSSGSTAVTYPTLSITVTSGVITAATLVTNGVGFKDTTTVLTVTSAAMVTAGFAAGGSGFTIPVATLQSGSQNTAVGYQALTVNTTGNSNTAVGYQSLSANTTGTNNTALGYVSLSSNTTGIQNTAFGNQAAFKTSTGSYNDAFGYASLYNNTTGQINTAIGRNTLQANTSGNNNAALGVNALYTNNANNNVAVGINALFLSSGANNTAIGYAAGYGPSPYTNANSTGTNNTYIGYQTVGSGSGNTNEMVIGYNAVGLGSNTTVIGNSSTTQTFLPYGNLVLGQTYDQGTGKLQVTGNATITGNTIGNQLYLQGGNNQFLYSQTFSNAYWAKGNAAVSGTFTAPDGTSTAVYAVPDNTSAIHNLSLGTIYTSALTYPVTMSIYAKAGAYNYIFLFTNAGGSSSQNYAFFNLSTGTVGTTLITSSIWQSPVITSVGNGWYRCSITLLSTSGTGRTYGFGISNADNTLTMTGDGTSGIYIWGAQQEPGYVASSYTPTTTTAVTTTNNISVPSGSITTSADSTFNTVKVGLGGGNVSTNTRVGTTALNATNTGTFNTGVGSGALSSNTGGNFNTGIGGNALNSNVSGSSNTAIGVAAMSANNNGSSNAGLGSNALRFNYSGGSNTATGFQALYYNYSASNNVATGYNALYYNTTASNLTAVGYQALQANTTNVATLGAITGGTGYTNGTYTGVVMTLSSGSAATTYPTATIVVSGGAVTTVTLTSNGVGFIDTTTVLTAPAASIGGTGSGFSVPVATLASGTQNTAMGYQAFYTNATGSDNTGLGYQTGYFTTGGGNTAIGRQALYTNTTGSNNVAIGPYSLYTNSTGLQSVAVGYNALNLATGNFNTAIGYTALSSTSTGTNNVGLGRQAGQGNSSANANTTGSNNTYIGYQTVGSANNNTNEMVIGYQAVGLGSNTTVIGNSSTTNTYIYGNLKQQGTYSVPYTFISTGVPFVLVSSGTMGNNGALSGITAVSNTYPNAYVYLPANAISTGSTAGWYYAVFSSTTAATIYNNTYTSGVPSIPASPTAFVTTGPGAYTQTTSAVTALNYTVAAGTISNINAQLNVNVYCSNNNTANTKYYRTNLANGYAQSITTNAVGGFLNYNTQMQSSLTSQFTYLLGGTASSLQGAYLSSNYGNSFSPNVQLTISVATDTITLESYTLTVSN